MQQVILFILAVLPIALICRYVYTKDSEKEPTSLLVGLFVSGISSCLLVFIINIILELLIPFFGYDTDQMSALELAIYIFIGVALVEEGCKWLFAKAIGFNNKNFDQPYDIIVYTTFISLGFAALENILYVMSYGIVMGYYLLLAKLSLNNHNKKLYRKNILLSILIPIITHGIYDYFLFLGNIFLLLVLLILFILFFKYNYKKVKQISSLTSKIFSDPKA